MVDAPLPILNICLVTFLDSGANDGASSIVAWVGWVAVASWVSNVDCVVASSTGVLFAGWVAFRLGLRGILSCYKFLAFCKD